DEAWRAWVDAIAEVGVGSPDVARLAAGAALTATRWHGTQHEHPSADELERLIADGLAAAGPADSPERVQLLIARSVMASMRYLGRDRAATEAAEEALAIARRLGDPDLQSGALDAKSALLMDSGQYARMHEVNGQRMALVHQLRENVEIGDAYAMAAWA